MRWRVAAANVPWRNAHHFRVESIFEVHTKVLSEATRF